MSSLVKNKSGKLGGFFYHTNNKISICRELWHDEPPPPKCFSCLCKPPNSATQITIQCASHLESPSPLLGMSFLIFKRIFRIFI